jgi:hypothetical protein
MSNCEIQVFIHPHPYSLAEKLIVIGSRRHFFDRAFKISSDSPLILGSFDINATRKR